MRSRVLARVLTVILLALVALPARPAGASTATWWNASYSHRLGISVLTADALPNNYQLSVTVNHAALVAAGNSLPSGDDLRVVRWNGSAYTELDRVLAVGSSWNSATTKLYFKTQAAISAGTTNTDYYLYYGYSSASAPPANPASVYKLFDDFSGGSIDTTKWAIEADGGGITTTQTGGELKASGTANGGGNWGGLYSNTGFGPGYISESSFKIVSQSSTAQKNWIGDFGLDYGGSGRSQLGVGSNNDPVKSVGYGGPFTSVGVSTMSTATFGYQRIAESLTSDGTAKEWENGVLQATRTGADTSSGPLWFDYSPQVAPQTFDVRFDDIVVRRYVANEPTTVLEQSSDISVSVLVSPSMTFTIGAHGGTCNGVAQSTGAVVNGGAISLGHINGGSSAAGAQDLQVVTNANSGFTVWARYTGTANDGHGHTFADLPVGTNVAPAAFTGAGSEAFGYTTSESALGTAPANRFTSGGAKWAAFSTSNAEVSYSSGATDHTICVAVKMAAAPTTVAATYTTAVIYTAVPTF